jgi:hypothetical protein
MLPSPVQHSLFRFTIHYSKFTFNFTFNFCIPIGLDDASAAGMESLNAQVEIE